MLTFFTSFIAHALTLKIQGYMISIEKDAERMITLVGMK